MRERKEREERKERVPSQVSPVQGSLQTHTPLIHVPCSEHLGQTVPSLKLILINNQNNKNNNLLQRVEQSWKHELQVSVSSHTPSPHVSIIIKIINDSK